MRKSQYGKETSLVWEGCAQIENVRLIPTASTLLIPDDLQRKIDEEFKRATEKNPHFFDGMQWRTEFVHGAADNLLIYVSPSRYSWHNVMRRVQDQPMQFYPNPLTINTVQETSDGHILVGVRGKTSDQRGLALMGAGFVERVERADKTSKDPEPIGFVVQKECLEETRYNEKRTFYMSDAHAIAVVFGSNHDTTVGVHLPLFATKEDVGLANEEHSDLILVPNDETTIRKLLAEGGYKGIPAADHLLGCLEAYLNNKKTGKIVSNYQH
jgi:hypothetical protein